MKKQEIKRRKRVMPATPGQQQIHIHPNSACADSSVSPDPIAGAQPDSPTQQLQSEHQHSATSSGAEAARRNLRTIAIDYTGYDSSAEHDPHSDASRKRAHSTTDPELGPPASRVQRVSPSIASMLADRPAADESIDPSLGGTPKAPSEKDRKAQLKMQKLIEADMMRQRLKDLENEIEEMGEDEAG